ncbi:MAG: hypothetical protein AB7P40_19000 [Chloroflexota bacterium]
MSDTSDAAAQVDLVLAQRGLPVSAEERERLIRLYPMMDEWTSAVRVAEARYAEPALIYPATFER